MKKKIIAAVESRLRSARIYDPAVLKPILRVRADLYIKGLGKFEVISIFEKSLFDSLSGEKQLRPVWVSAGSRTYGDRDELLHRLSQQTDEFLLEFLRVNEKACALRDKKTS